MLRQLELPYYTKKTAKFQCDKAYFYRDLAWHIASSQAMTAKTALGFPICVFIAPRRNLAAICRSIQVAFFCRYKWGQALNFQVDPVNFLVLPRCGHRLAANCINL
ncbi:MAG: hypothetical protein HKO71_00495 [Pseudomonadales bacterium]|nr:hypothetical protein [Pseudomonadales bacterium]